MFLIYNSTLVHLGYSTYFIFPVKIKSRHWSDHYIIIIVICNVYFWHAY